MPLTGTRPSKSITNRFNVAPQFGIGIVHHLLIVLKTGSISLNATSTCPRI